MRIVVQGLFDSREFGGDPTEGPADVVQERAAHHPVYLRMTVSLLSGSVDHVRKRKKVELVPSQTRRSLRA